MVSKCRVFLWVMWQFCDARWPQAADSGHDFRNYSMWKTHAFAIGCSCTSPIHFNADCKLTFWTSLYLYQLKGVSISTGTKYVEPLQDVKIMLPNLFVFEDEEVFEYLQPSDQVRASILAQGVCVMGGEGRGRIPRGIGGRSLCCLKAYRQRVSIYCV